jgi:hypothetical protein
MVYVVEIENGAGGRAVKEYDANSPYELNFVVKHELRQYPNFRVIARQGPALSEPSEPPQRFVRWPGQKPSHVGKPGQPEAIIP